MKRRKSTKNRKANGQFKKGHGPIRRKTGGRRR